MDRYVIRHDGYWECKTHVVEVAALAAAHSAADDKGCKVGVYKLMREVNPRPKVVIEDIDDVLASLYESRHDKLHSIVIALKELGVKTLEHRTE